MVSGGRGSHRNHSRASEGQRAGREHTPCQTRGRWAQRSRVARAQSCCVTMLPEEQRRLPPLQGRAPVRRPFLLIACQTRGFLASQEKGGEGRLAGWPLQSGTPRGSWRRSWALPHPMKRSGSEPSLPAPCSEAVRLCVLCRVCVREVVGGLQEASASWPFPTGRWVKRGACTWSEGGACVRLGL